MANTTNKPFNIMACVYFHLGTINNKSHPNKITKLQIEKISEASMVIFYIDKAMYFAGC